MVKEQNNTAIANALVPFRLLDAPLEAMPLLAIQRSWAMVSGFNIANPFGWLALGTSSLLRPGKEPAQCGQSPVHRCWCNRRYLPL